MSHDDPKKPRQSLADKVVADPGSLADVNVFVGWIGKAAREKSVRIYLRLDFSNYIEVPESDVVYVKHSDTDLAFSIAWVERTTRLRITESDVDVVRAWKDREYRSGLTEAQRKCLPQHPSGAVEVPSVLLGNVIAGSPLVCTPDSTFAWTCCPLKLAVVS